jgi:hypothetical protein
MEMVKIGTVVVSNSQWGMTVGQVADHKKTDFGTMHVLLVDGKFTQCGHIGTEDMRGVGWKVANANEIRLMNTYHRSGK